jgi:hypothetical protein
MPPQADGYWNFREQLERRETMRGFHFFLGGCLTFALAGVLEPALAQATPTINQATQSESSEGKPKSIKKLPAKKTSIDACALLTSKEIQSVQGQGLEAAKVSKAPRAGLAISQCYFELPTKSHSISLSYAGPCDVPCAIGPREYWRETFHGNKGLDGEAGEKAESKRPMMITGLGEEAYWAGNAVGGALYVLKRKCFIRISVGGPGDQSSRIKKSKTLARMALKRL